MIALITPTGGRQKQFALCEKYMQRQDYDGEVLWVIVDDCLPLTTSNVQKDFKANWKIEKVYPTPEWRRGQNTQARNLQAGLDVVKRNKAVSSVFIIEDDDYYTSTYLTQMVANSSGFLACGEVHTIYYNTKNYVLRKFKNTRHSSLFQTVFDIALLPEFENTVKHNPKFIDIVFWGAIRNKKTNLFETENPLSIGIKGIDGRPGIGMGHKYLEMGEEKDRIEGMMKLKQRIGLDYLNYI